MSKIIPGQYKTASGNDAHILYQNQYTGDFNGEVFLKDKTGALLGSQETTWTPEGICIDEPKFTLDIQSRVEQSTYDSTAELMSKINEMGVRLDAVEQTCKELMERHSGKL